ncbi:potassium efflux system protein [Siphonobacter sp. SORGH_AS 1065]|nr:potassium efflux system protein [Siphonobacter sp. SORGH_AS_1065]
MKVCNQRTLVPQRKMQYKYYLLGIIFCLIGLFQSPMVSAQTSALTKGDTAYSIPDTLLFKLQKAQAAVTEINASNKKGYGISKIKQGLTEVEESIDPIKDDLNAGNKIIDSKDLLNYRLILKDAQTKLANWQKSLTKSSNDLQRSTENLVTLSNDSLLTVNDRDSSARKLFNNQVTELKRRLQHSGKTATAHLDSVSKLLAEVSSYNLAVTDLQALIDERLNSSVGSIFNKESPFIWSAPTFSDHDSVQSFFKNSYLGQRKILSYFIGSSWDNRAVLILVGIAFFIWINRTFKKVRQLEIKQQLEKSSYEAIKPIPIVATLIVVLNLVPFFESDSPSLYIELTQFLLLVVITGHIWKKISKSDLTHWLTIVGLYIVLVVVNILVRDGIFLRLTLIALNIGFLYQGFTSYRKLKEAQFGENFIRPVAILYLGLNILAVVTNIFGRLSLSKIFSITAVIGLTQMVGLAYFVKVLTEGLDLQIKLSSCSDGLFSRVNINRVRATAKRVLSFIAVLLWLLVLVINLNISNQTFAFLDMVLSKSRTFGSITFTLGNVLFFVIIVYLSNLLQKHIGILFGESNITFDEQNQRKSSKLVLVRLVIIIVGILMAITASGVPLDRLTVVLGALSVGIGLGMQNIVNNFVSGIILIFEKPFSIGDYVELADKKGKVKDIGIRSSIMLTPQGSEVVIPNGDLLSGRLVNWTGDNPYLKSEIIIKINADADLDQVKKIIKEEIRKIKDTVKNSQPEIYINSLAADAIELKIIVWVSSIYTEASCKSQLLQQLLTRFRDVSVKIL